MQRRLLSGVVGALAWFAAATAPAEVRIAWERNDRAAASGEFRFRNVPPPSATDAATNARFRLVAGRDDPNSGGLDALGDGRLPRHEDQPDANFFYDAGTAGGRLLVDLGNLIQVEQINTYSWHRGGRGPQVFRLYASDAAGENGPPVRGAAVDWQQAGWRLLASVDTRPDREEYGGQYGVSISESTGGVLGTYRWLLFDISPTSGSDRFGQTFFSEIDVADGRQHAAAPREPGEVEIVFDTSEVPELQPWVEAKLRPVCQQWYPIIVRMLPSEGYTAPRRVTVIFRRDMRGVAAASGTRIECSGDWFRRNLDGEAAGAVVHELVHVVQRYSRVRGGQPNPGWLVEGVADYIRWFHYEPEPLRPRPDPARAKYTDSYRTTAAFLNYVVQTHDPDVVQKLNAAMRHGRYAEDLWRQYTGRTVDELWGEYVQALPPRGKRGPSTATR